MPQDPSGQPETASSKSQRPVRRRFSERENARLRLMLEQAENLLLLQERMAETMEVIDCQAANQQRQRVLREPVQDPQVRTRIAAGAHEP